MTNYILLKAALLTEGIRADADSLGGLGTLYKEQNHGLFGWDFENHTSQKLPDDFCLPDGTVVQFRYNSKSPYRVKMEAGKLALFLNDELICALEWIKRPDFYTRQTTEGNDMVKVGQIGGRDCLFFCYQNYCAHFSCNKQCSFCNLVRTSQVYNSVMKKKEISDIGEVAKAAWSEGDVKHMLLTGGCFSHEKEIGVVSDIMASIRLHTGLDRVPGVILPSPAKGDNIKRYYETGIKAIGYSMEIWDEKLYNALCPGKSENTSHAEFLDSIKTAVNVFGAGNVFVALVMGLEQKETFLEGIKVISSLGANIVPFAWSPNPGSKLEGHRAPFAEWYYDVISEAAEIVRSSKVPSGTENHCFECDGNSLLHDALRMR